MVDLKVREEQLDLELHRNSVSDKIKGGTQNYQSVIGVTGEATV